MLRFNTLSNLAGKIPAFSTRRRDPSGGTHDSGARLPEWTTGVGHKEDAHAASVRRGSFYSMSFTAPATVSAVRPGDIVVLAMQEFEHPVNTNRSNGFTFRNIAVYSSAVRPFRRRIPKTY